MATVALAAIGVVPFTTRTVAAPLDDINQYADRCATELGGGAGAYMPRKILHDPPNYGDTKEIPVFWNGKRIEYKQTGATPDKGQYLFGGRPGEKADPLKKQPAYPDGANTTGDIISKDQLRCDFWSHVNAEDGKGCLPGQRIFQTDIGTCTKGDIGQECRDDSKCGHQGKCEDIVTWTFIFRRSQPPVNGAGWGAFKEFNPYYFNNMDAIAFKKDTGATCWFDTFQVEPALGAKKVSTTKDEWWLPSTWLPPHTDTDGVPKGIPRPGGKDRVKQEVAKKFWNAPKDVQEPKRLNGTPNPGERCILCHGNGPVVVSRWINQYKDQDKDPSQFDEAKSAFPDRFDRELPYWSAAKLFPNLFFKNFGLGKHPDQQCGFCHNYWSVSANTMPGGTLAEAMTKDPPRALPPPAAPPTQLASFFRLQIDEAQAKLVGTCDGGTRKGQACVSQAGCPKGACVGGQDAGVLREMPHPFTAEAMNKTTVPGTPKDWDDEVRPQYDAMTACLRVCNAGSARAGLVCAEDLECPGSTCRALDAAFEAQCDNTVEGKPPKFVGAEGANAPGIQRLAPPTPAVKFSVTRTKCLVEKDGSETCDYEVKWDDPIKGDSDYHAADLYYLQMESVPNGKTPQTKRFCDGTNDPVKTASTQPISGSNWAQTYSVRGKLGACSKMEFRLCGGYTVGENFHAPVRSTDEGQTKTLVTACANK
jgi:hypothetical protein